MRQAFSLDDTILDKDLLSTTTKEDRDIFDIDKTRMLHSTTDLIVYDFYLTIVFNNRTDFIF